MVECINNNAYKFDLLGEYGIHAIFNVADLSPFYANDEFDLGTNHLQEEWRDEGLKAVQTSHDQFVLVPNGPLTRSRTKKLKEPLQALVCAVQDRVGCNTRSIEGLQHEESTFYTLFQVLDGGLHEVDY